MPPIYFHGNHNGYKECKNTTEQILSYKRYIFFQLIHADEPTQTLFILWYDSCAWPSECALSFTSLLLKRNAPPTASLCSHPLFGLHKHSASVDECQWVPLFVQRNSMTHLWTKCTLTSDRILSNCPSAAICHTATKCNGIPVGRFNLYCHTTNICLWCHGPT